MLSPSYLDRAVVCDSMKDSESAHAIAAQTDELFFDRFAARRGSDNVSKCGPHRVAPIRDPGGQGADAPPGDRGVCHCRHAANGSPLLPREGALREAEELLIQSPVLYPNAAVVRTALRGAAACRLTWCDTHLWAYAEHYALRELICEDFQHGRLYGSVQACNPFLGDYGGDVFCRCYVKCGIKY